STAREPHTGRLFGAEHTRIVPEKSAHNTPAKGSPHGRRTVSANRRTLQNAHKNAQSVTWDQGEARDVHATLESGRVWKAKLKEQMSILTLTHGRLDSGDAGGGGR